MAASTSPFMWTANIKPQTSHFRNSLHSFRGYSHGCCQVRKLRSWRSYSEKVSNWKASSFVVASLVDPDGAIMSDWVSGSEQLLLMASICLTYMAGVVPVPKNNFASKILSQDNVLRESLGSSSGSARKNDGSTNLGYAWDAVKNKILDMLDAVERRSNLRKEVLEFDERHMKQPLSLSAVPDGPKLRLLWISFQRLNEEVNDVLGDFETGNIDNWSKACMEIIQRSCYPVCMSWLKEEFRLENRKSDEGLISSMVEKLKEDDTVLLNVKKLGKEELYAELLYFLKFSSLRKNSCYDDSLFLLHGDVILEDLVITLADGIASAYLELISVDGNLSNEMNRLGMTMCDLSTRALQRLRNEVALNQWLYQNLEAVVSMYEDRFDLRTLQLKVIDQTSQNQTEICGWWKKLTLREPIAVQPALCYAVISQFSMPVKRTKALRALTGWRYYFSLYLELSDISMPLIRALIDKVSNAISFFLVTLIGRSLGLIYTGIRQSLRWK